MRSRPVYYDIVAVILVTLAAYGLPLGYLWLKFGGWL